VKGNPMNETAPRALRAVISIIGCCNAGKSSLINAITGQEVAIVSPYSGTTTDAIAKPYELVPLGPVTFYDTAGLDDKGELGSLRIKATQKVLYRSDMAVAVIAETGITPFDRDMIAKIQKINIPLLIAFNKSDIKRPTAEDIAYCRQHNLPFIEVSSATGNNIHQLKEMLIALAPEDFKTEPALVADLINPGDTVVMVVPIDLSAPKGRLILPQVQVLREILDCNATAVVAKETELAETLKNLKQKPSLIITDSQVVQKVNAIVPDEIKMTTFSTLFARNKGDFSLMAEAANILDRLKDGDKVLIAEACSHHVQPDDIGKVKIPNLVKKYTGKNILFEFCAGNDFPENLESYSLVIHCGACMLNRREMKRRINECIARNTPITNYGMTISKVQGILPRVILPFSK